MKRMLFVLPYYRTLTVNRVSLTRLGMCRSRDGIHKRVSLWFETFFFTRYRVQTWLQNLRHISQMSELEGASLKANPEDYMSGVGEMYSFSHYESLSTASGNNDHKNWAVQSMSLYWTRACQEMAYVNMCASLNERLLPHATLCLNVSLKSCGMILHVWCAA